MATFPTSTKISENSPPASAESAEQQHGDKAQKDRQQTLQHYQRASGRENLEDWSGGKQVLWSTSHDTSRFATVTLKVKECLSSPHKLNRVQWEIWQEMRRYANNASVQDFQKVTPSVGRSMKVKHCSTARFVLLTYLAHSSFSNAHTAEEETVPQPLLFFIAWYTHIFQTILGYRILFWGHTSNRQTDKRLIEWYKY